LVRDLADLVGSYKVGNQLFTAEGPRAVEKLASLGVGVFLDLKYHDIPNTVAKAVAAAAGLPNVRLLTLHAGGGTAMMRAASEAVAGLNNRPSLLGVTILTSLGSSALRELRLPGPVTSRAVALARLAKKAGLDGAVSSAREAPAIRRVCGRDFLILVPGVRPANAAAHDQSRVATPAEAIHAGADYLVVGRPITAAANPRQAAQSILDEITSALPVRRS